MARVSVTCYADPGCPWGYSVEPSLRVLEWRYGDQLDWRLVTIGLTERAQEYLDRGYTPAWMAAQYAGFRRYGMPFTTEPKARVAATGAACRAVVAARLERPSDGWRALRALQLAWFTTPLVPDEPEAIASALNAAGLDGERLVARLGGRDVEEAYAADKAEARTAAGSPAELQGKTATSDGPVRYTAPSLVLERDRQRFVAGGFQTIEAYDVLVANVDPGLERRAAPDEPLALLEAFPLGLVTQEVAQLLTRGNDRPDRLAAERALIELVGAGRARRAAVGDDALWIRS